MLDIVGVISIPSVRKTNPVPFGISRPPTTNSQLLNSGSFSLPLSCEDSKVLLLPHPMFHPSLLLPDILFSSLQQSGFHRRLFPAGSRAFSGDGIFPCILLKEPCSF
jgi:hypothetical protein